MPEPSACDRPFRVLRSAVSVPALALVVLAGPPGMHGPLPPNPLHSSAFGSRDHGALPPVEIDWRMLAKLNYRTGEMPEELKKLDGQLVRMPGFVVPLEDYVESASEFLLVPYYGACVHVPPPPPNQMVYVEMQDQRKAEFGWWEPIWLEGTLRINTVESPYGVVGYEIDGVKVEPYRN